MMFSTAGSKLYIGGPIAMKLADFIASDFAGQTWTEITNHESLGSMGDTSAELEVKHNRDMRTKRLKGRRTASTMELVCTMDMEDAGQLALIAAEKSYDNFAFRMVFNDAPEGGTPSERLFIAVVGGLIERLDNADDLIKLDVSLWVNSNQVRVNAAA